MLGLLFATAALAAPAQDAAAVTASESAPSVMASTVEVVGDFRLLMEESSSGSGSEAISSSTSVVVSMTAAGDVSDYDAAAQSTLVSSMAGVLGVAPVDVSLTVSAASVNLVFTVAVADGAAAAAVSAAVASALPTAAAASSLLGASVLSAPTAATFDDEVSPPPPPPPPPFSPGEVPVEAVTFIFTVDTDFNGGSADGSDIDIDALRAAFASSAGVGTQKEDVVATYVSGTVVIVIEVEEGASAALVRVSLTQAQHAPPVHALAALLCGSHVAATPPQRPPSSVPPTPTHTHQPPPTHTRPPSLPHTRTSHHLHTHSHTSTSQ